MRVLIAENEPISRLLLENLLALWGYRVEVATDGDQVWWILLQENAPRLAALAGVMPGTETLEICRQLRCCIDRICICVLRLTARAQEQDIGDGAAHLY